jgi:transcriptional regulator with XRE-family HTH domain
VGRTVVAAVSSTFSKRLKAARLAAGLSQKRLGIAAGLDEFVAGTRVNRYERGVHEPDPVMAARLAKMVGVPRAYFYADDPTLARLILAFARLSKRKQAQLLKHLEGGA